MAFQGMRTWRVRDLEQFNRIPPQIDRGSQAKRQRALDRSLGCRTRNGREMDELGQSDVERVQTMARRVLDTGEGSPDQIGREGLTSKSKE